MNSSMRSWVQKSLEPSGSMRISTTLVGIGGDQLLAEERRADGVTLLVVPEGHFLAGKHGGSEPNAEYSLVVRPARGPELADGDLDVGKELRVLLPILDTEQLAA